MIEDPRDGSRRRVDLSGLPKPVLTLIGLIVVIPIATLGWIVGKDEPVPAWITEILVPVLSIVALVFMVILVVDWIRRRARR